MRKLFSNRGLAAVLFAVVFILKKGILQYCRYREKSGPLAQYITEEIMYAVGLNQIFAANEDEKATTGNEKTNPRY